MRWRDKQITATESMKAQAQQRAEIRTKSRAKPMWRKQRERLSVKGKKYSDGEM